uniref:HTH CENPB-type domain-containing protein n=1 Tax=Latimeria chalumnae TaxID=7897 RepID=H3BDN3_LATCH
RKRIHAPEHEDIDEAIHHWFVAAREKNIPVSGDLLKSKAEQFTRCLDIENFKGSNGWIERFKNRHEMRFKTIVEETASVDYGYLSHSGMKLQHKRDLYNVDETGLFHQLLPRKTLASSDNCAGTKAKQQITLLIGANMDGSDCMLPLFIGKFGKPRCFKNVNTLPLTYQCNTKAWMTAEIWKEWARTFDEKMYCQQRKVVLFVDNCPAHPKVTGLKAVTVHFLPPNSTSVLQPMAQGVIQCFKSCYWKLLLRKIVDCIDTNMSFQVDILQAMHLVRKAWEQVTDKCITNCFKHAGWIQGSPDVVIEMPVVHITEECNTLGISESLIDKITEEESHVSTTEGMDDGDIIASIMAKKPQDNESCDDDDDVDCEPMVPSLHEVLKAVDTERSYAQTLQDTKDLFGLINKLENTCRANCAH